MVHCPIVRLREQKLQGMGTGHESCLGRGLLWGISGPSHQRRVRTSLEGTDEELAESSSLYLPSTVLNCHCANGRDISGNIYMTPFVFMRPFKRPPFAEGPLALLYHIR